MPRKWGHVCIGIAALLMVAFSGSAYAWEFAMKGSFNWTHEWYNQTGSQGFFGTYNIDRGATTNGRLANLNFWNGGQFDTNFVTGSNAGWSYFNVEFEPEIKINPAIKIKGLYRLGTYGDPATSDYQTQNAPGAGNAFSEGQWTQFWVTSNLPWGVFTVGKRPWQFGNALQYDGADAATTESLALVAPFGPLDMGIAYYPYRYAGSSGIWAISGRNSTQSAYGDPYDLPLYPTGGDPVSMEYYSRADRSGSFSKDFLGFVTYSNGPLRAGVLGAVGSYHIGPEAVLNNPEGNGVSTDTNRYALDSAFNHGTIFMQFNNGRFFLNAEGSWLYWHDKYEAGNFLITQDDTLAVNLPYNRYIEQWKWMAELGVMAGPAKLSALVAFTPGPDRRNGLYIDKQPGAFVWHPTFDSHFLGNFSLFSPYSYIFAYDYGAGLNAYNLSGDGFVRDAFVLAGRLDYAVAANLNLFGSFFWAKRTSDGYPWGALKPVFDDAGNGDGNIDFARVSPAALNLGALFNAAPNNVPNITERALGYEINVGFDWKLLEGWNFTTLVGYWAPGDWFKYACIDRSVPGWDQDAFAGVRPKRTIDGVIGGNFSMTYEF